MSQDLGSIIENMVFLLLLFFLKSEIGDSNPVEVTVFQNYLYMKYVLHQRLR